MMASVVPPDLEMWLTGYLRSKLSGVAVSNKEPEPNAGAFPDALVVVRDDSGPKVSEVTFERSIGVSVLKGNKTNDKPAGDLARQVYKLLTDSELPMQTDSPIASIEGAFGPYSVIDERPQARKYFTVDYIVVGEIEN